MKGLYYFYLFVHFSGAYLLVRHSGWHTPDQLGMILAASVFVMIPFILIRIRNHRRKKREHQMQAAYYRRWRNQ